MAATSGCYLLAVVAEPVTEDDKQTILRRLNKGLLSWDVNSAGCDLKGLQSACENVTSKSVPESGMLIQYSTEGLGVEVLVNPPVSTLKQCVKNLLTSTISHKHIIHSGYAFTGTGSWILQNGAYTFDDFLAAFQDPLVHREKDCTIHVHCDEEGDWTSSQFAKEAFTKVAKVSLNPPDKVDHLPGSDHLVDCLDSVLSAQSLTEIMEASSLVGNIRFNRPTLYMFPAGQGDCALFGINGFNMLVDGGFNRKPCAWDFIRHLDRLDAVLVTRLSESNLCSMSTLMKRKTLNNTYPQIGYVFCNVAEGKNHSPTEEDQKVRSSLLVSVVGEGHKFINTLNELKLIPHQCWSDNSTEPFVLYHKVGHGTLEMYVLSPPKDSKEMRDFLEEWSSYKEKFSHVKSEVKNKGRECMIPLSHVTSICAIVVWRPNDPKDTITRILFPGSAPQSKIFEGLEKLKSLDILRHPRVTKASLSAVILSKPKPAKSSTSAVKSTPPNRKNTASPALSVSSIASRNGDINGIKKDIKLNKEVKGVKKETKAPKELKKENKSPREVKSSEVKKEPKKEVKETKLVPEKKSTVKAPPKKSETTSKTSPDVKKTTVAKKTTTATKKEVAAKPNATAKPSEAKKTPTTKSAESKTAKEVKKATDTKSAPKPKAKATTTTATKSPARTKPTPVPKSPSKLTKAIAASAAVATAAVTVGVAELIESKQAEQEEVLKVEIVEGADKAAAPEDMVPNGDVNEAVEVQQVETVEPEPNEIPVSPVRQDLLSPALSEPVSLTASDTLSSAPMETVSPTPPPHDALSPAEDKDISDIKMADSHTPSSEQNVFDAAEGIPAEAAAVDEGIVEDSEDAVKVGNDDLLDQDVQEHVVPTDDLMSTSFVGDSIETVKAVDEISTIDESFSNVNIDGVTLEADSEQVYDEHSKQAQEQEQTEQSLGQEINAAKVDEGHASPDVEIAEKIDDIDSQLASATMTGSFCPGMEDEDVEETCLVQEAYKTEVEAKLEGYESRIEDEIKPVEDSHPVAETEPVQEKLPLEEPLCHKDDEDDDVPMEPAPPVPPEMKFQSADEFESCESPKHDELAVEAERSMKDVSEKCDAAGQPEKPQILPDQPLDHEEHDTSSQMARETCEDISVDSRSQVDDRKDESFSKSPEPLSEGLVDEEEVGRTATPSSDVHIEVGRTATPSSDVHEEVGRTATPSSDVHVEAGRTATPSSDVHVEAGRTATPSSDVHVEAGRTATPSSDVHVEAGRTATPSSDVHVEMERTATPSSDVHVEMERTATPSSDVHVEAGRTATPSSDVHVETGRTATPLSDVHVEMERTATPSSDVPVEVGDRRSPYLEDEHVMEAGKENEPAFEEELVAKTQMPLAAEPEEVGASDNEITDNLQSTNESMVKKDTSFKLGAEERHLFEDHGCHDTEVHDHIAEDVLHKDSDSDNEDLEKEPVQPVAADDVHTSVASAISRADEFTGTVPAETEEFVQSPQHTEHKMECEKDMYPTEGKQSEEEKDRDSAEDDEEMIRHPTPPGAREFYDNVGPDEAEDEMRDPIGPHFIPPSSFRGKGSEIDQPLYEDAEDSSSERAQSPVLEQPVFGETDKANFPELVNLSGGTTPSEPQSPKSPLDSKKGNIAALDVMEALSEHECSDSSNQSPLSRDGPQDFEEICDVSNQSVPLEQPQTFDKDQKDISENVPEIHEQNFSEEAEVTSISTERHFLEQTEEKSAVESSSPMQRDSPDDMVPIKDYGKDYEDEDFDHVHESGNLQEIPDGGSEYNAREIDQETANYQPESDISHEMPSGGVRIESDLHYAPESEVGFVPQDERATSREYEHSDPYMQNEQPNDFVSRPESDQHLGMPAEYQCLSNEQEDYHMQQEHVSKFEPEGDSDFVEESKDLGTDDTVDDSENILLAGSSHAEQTSQIPPPGYEDTAQETSSTKADVHETVLPDHSDLKEETDFEKSASAGGYAESKSISTEAHSEMSAGGDAVLIDDETSGVAESALSHSDILNRDHLDGVTIETKEITTTSIHEETFDSNIKFGTEAEADHDVSHRDLSDKVESGKIVDDGCPEADQVEMSEIQDSRFHQFYPNGYGSAPTDGVSVADDDDDGIVTVSCGQTVLHEEAIVSGVNGSSPVDWKSSYPNDMPESFNSHVQSTYAEDVTSKVTEEHCVVDSHYQSDSPEDNSMKNDSPPDIPSPVCPESAPDPLNPLPKDLPPTYDTINNKFIPVADEADNMNYVTLQRKGKFGQGTDDPFGRPSEDDNNSVPGNVSSYAYTNKAYNQEEEDADGNHIYKAAFVLEQDQDIGNTTFDGNNPQVLPESSMPHHVSPGMTYSPGFPDIHAADPNYDFRLEEWGKPMGLPTPPESVTKAAKKPVKPPTSSVKAANKVGDKRPSLDNGKSPANVTASKLTSSPLKKPKDPASEGKPVYVDLAYVPHHGDLNYSDVEFFKRVRARYYVFSGIGPSKEVLNALLEAKKSWKENLEVTIIPTYETDALGYWMAQNQDILSEYSIEVAPSASRCTVNLQDHETSCAAYRLEF